VRPEGRERRNCAIVVSKNTTSNAAARAHWILRNSHCRFPIFHRRCIHDPIPLEVVPAIMFPTSLTTAPAPGNDSGLDQVRFRRPNHGVKPR